MNMIFLTQKILKVLEKNNEIVLSKPTIEMYLKSDILMIYHWKIMNLLKSKNMTNQSLEKNILIMNLAKQFLLVKLYLELESLAKKIKKVNAWACINKGRKTSIQLFAENMTKELFVSVIEKHLKEIETMTGKLWANMKL